MKIDEKSGRISFFRKKPIINYSPCCEPLFIFKAIDPPKYAIGIYANVRSKIVNHVGEGNIKIFIIPPIKNQTPITKANFILWSLTIIAVTNAPNKVPSAWARKGIIKCLGSNKCKDSFNPSMVVVIAPSGGAIMLPLIIIRPIFNIPPANTPITTAIIFLKTGFILFTFYVKTYHPLNPKLVV